MGAKDIISMHSARAKNRLDGQYILALPPKGWSVDTGLWGDVSLCFEDSWLTAWPKPARLY